ncbi:Prenyltransferase and squalene oxidase repeat-containing protein [Micromonospora rhizosphaerae]|uniref:Prenyltransferase and squalene oxidase repeat-containing protein n=1 Tax=Micromonospora rhizosphaerae TaxID=568872 RepID=A0A1C6T564_9ACTN|nr:prenyltransferase/squalene oxidase repeat-containing protein [Micromonospora rhizosphaerae]SCL36960.1 Prenyltransferase and squalene oxidase repeat-containing protein [Micromonospora rhizosphaerae]
MTTSSIDTQAQAGTEVAGEARELLAAVALEPAGRVTPSVYETARVVADAPWLTGHGRRLAYLLASQRRDGGWGAPGGYAVVPTVSAVEALLGTLRAGGGDRSGEPSRAELAAAARRGLGVLAGWLLERPSLPDTPAADLIVPGLVERIDGHLAWFAAHPGDGFDSPFPGLPGVDRRRLDALHALLAAGRPVPQKLLHAFEVLGSTARRHRDVSLVAGSIGASPAATAAWVGSPAGADRAALAYLETAVGPHGGPVPCCTPITVFERAWALSTLARAGVPATPAPKLVAELAAVLGPQGTPTSPGLPADADTTSVTLYALARLGHPVDPASLLHYDLGSHFCTWQGEDGRSVTTNAHVLEALGWHARRSEAGADRYGARAAALAGWLRDQQEADGRWADRWHASPYYATSCAVAALDRYAPAGVAGEAVDLAVDWVVATQRADGSWGRWTGTVEETAYALQVLLGVGRPARPGVREAAKRGLSMLTTADGRGDDPPLWHDKDLYTPVLIVKAATIAARQLARTRSDLVGTGSWAPERARRGTS